MTFLNVKSLKQFEDLIAEANIIVAGDQGSNRKTDSSAGENDQNEDRLLEQFDSFLDKFLDKAINPEDYADIEVKRGQELVKKYLDYCRRRLSRIAEQLKEEFSQPEPSAAKIKGLADKQLNIIKKISMLEDIYTGLKSREDEEIKQIADEIVNKINEIQQNLSLEDFGIEAVGKRNYELLQKLNSQTDEAAQKEIAAEIVDTWETVEIISDNLPEPKREELNRLKSTTLSAVEDKVGKENLTLIVNGSMDKEEADLIARIVQLNYRTFTTEEEIDQEFLAIRAKINALKGDSKHRRASSPETIKYISDMADAAEAAIRARYRNKSLELNKLKGIHYDFNVKLKLYERTPIPVTGKQIADSSRIMKLRKGLQSLLDLVFGGPSEPLTPAGEAWANFGGKLHLIYAKTINTSAKAVGKLMKGREGEMKADALTRMFIPNTAVLDKKPEKSVFEETGAPGMAFQVPGSIGGMGDPVAPTPTSVGSGDDFNPRKKEKAKRPKRILEFNDFVSQFLK